MSTELEVLFAPVEFTALHQRDLRETVCVVFDVFRATSTMVTALANGAAALTPVAEISEALAARRQHANALLAGERDGLRIGAALTGGIDFDLGNSPREFTPERIAGRMIVTTTTNGTRALQACAHAQSVLIGAFLNLRATADFIAKRPPPKLLLVCSGTLDQSAFEDILGAGALAHLLWPHYADGAISDSVRVARQIYALAENDLVGAARHARNGRRLLANPELRDDVPFCLMRDQFNIVAGLQKDGCVRRLEG